MRDAGALLSNLPALLVIVRSPTQVGKFALIFVQLLQEYLFNACIHICSTRLSDLLFLSWRSRARPSSYLITQSVSLGHLYVLTRLATPHVGKSSRVNDDS